MTIRTWHARFLTDTLHEAAVVLIAMIAGVVVYGPVDVDPDCVSHSDETDIAH